jgi:hypothetical protein
VSESWSAPAIPKPPATLHSDVCFPAAPIPPSLRRHLVPDRTWTPRLHTSAATAQHTHAVLTGTKKTIAYQLDCQATFGQLPKCHALPVLIMSVCITLGSAEWWNRLGSAVDTVGTHKRAGPRYKHKCPCTNQHQRHSCTKKATPHRSRSAVLSTCVLPGFQHTHTAAGTFWAPFLPPSYLPIVPAALVASSGRQTGWVYWTLTASQPLAADQAHHTCAVDKFLTALILGNMMGDVASRRALFKPDAVRGLQANNRTAIDKKRLLQMSSKSLRLPQARTRNSQPAAWAAHQIVCPPSSCALVFLASGSSHGL